MFTLEQLPKKWQRLAYKAADDIADRIESGDAFWEELNSETCILAEQMLPGPDEGGDFRPIRIPSGQYVDGQSLVYDWQTAVEALVEEQFDDVDEA